MVTFQLNGSNLCAMQQNNCGNSCSNFINYFSNTSLLNGLIRIQNNALVSLRFSGFYNLNGQTIPFTISPYTYLQSRSVMIPANAINIRLKVEYLDLTFKWSLLYYGVFEKSGQYCFLAYGSALLIYFVPVKC